MGILELQAIIRGRVDLERGIHSDGWRGYAGLVDMGYQKHLRVDHGKDEFAKGTVHINGMEGFWRIAKIRLAKYQGLSRSTFYLHLKKSEWRYNHRTQNLYNLLSRMFIQQPLN
jgi:transposase-like protein